MLDLDCMETALQSVHCEEIRVGGGGCGDAA